MPVGVVVISVVAALVCLTVQVDTKDVGGITGTIVIQPDTPEEQVEQMRIFLRTAGVGWICLGILSLVWARRRQGQKAISLRANRLSRIQSHRSLRNPLLYFGGIFIFGIGIICGLAFVAIAGMDSPEFGNYFTYFIGMYVVGTTLILLGK